MQKTQDTAFFGHPRGLSTLFFTELWERFGYYGMRSLLTLFLAAPLAIGGFGFSDTNAYAIYGLYTSSVYMMSLPGGWIADRIVGQRKAVLYGGILIAIGYLMLASPLKPVFFSGLAVVVCGTGLLKPNISTIVGQIYRPDDPRRDSGFSIFYMGINVGAMSAPLLVGYVGQRINWHLGFVAASLGMAIGVFVFLHGQKHLGDAGLHPVTPSSPDQGAMWRRQFRNGMLILAGLGALLLTLSATGVVQLDPIRLVNAAGVVLLLIIVALFGWMFSSSQWTPAERKRITVIAVLFTASAIFWSAFEQAGGSLNLFGDRFSNNDLLGFNFPASWYQSLNAFFIVSLAPVFAWLWLRLGSKQPSSPMKFALGLFFVGAGFLIIMIAAMRSAGGHKVSPLWLVATYLFHTMGELSLSPVGLSAMTRLAPVRVAGLMMGVWFLSLSAGNYLGGRIAALYGSLPMADLFRTVAIFSFVAGLVLAVIARPVAKLAENPQSER